MRHEIWQEPDVRLEPEKVLKWRLDVDRDGDVWLTFSDDEITWLNALWIRKDGTITRAGGIPEQYGLSLDDTGHIEISE